MSRTDAIDTKELDEQVARIAASTGFRGSKQLQNLLIVLVENRNQQPILKSDHVKATLWPGEKGKNDHDVDATLSRLRKKLQDYYSEEGVRDPVLIVAPMPQGGIRTKWIEVTKRQPPPPPPPPIDWRIVAAIVFLVLAAAIVLMPLRITQPENGVQVGSKPEIVGRGGIPWRLYYLVVEPETGGGGQYVQFDDGPLHHGLLLGWEQEVNIGDENTKSGTWFYVYVISTDTELRAMVDYVPATGRLLTHTTGDRPSHAIRVQLVK